MVIKRKGGRPSGPKTRCGETWTEAKFKSFISSQLRYATRKWAPIHNTQTKARVSRGLYECANCKAHVPPTIRVGRKKMKNIFVDHIKPIVDPKTGFTNWDEYINNMFCEEDNLQLLCAKCHNEKTQYEKELRKNKE